MKNVKNGIKVLSFKNFVVEKYVKDNIKENISMFRSEESINVEALKDVIVKILQDAGYEIDMIHFTVFDEKLKN